jgi:hypothetical protein
VGVNVSVAVSTLGVADGPPVRVRIINCVDVAGETLVNVAVMLGVGVAVGFSGVNVHASQPMQ